MNLCILLIGLYKCDPECARGLHHDFSANKQKENVQPVNEAVFTSCKACNNPNSTI